MLETMASIDGPVLALLDEIAQELSGFGSGNKAAEKFSDRSLFIRKMEEQHGQYPKRGSMLPVGHTRNKTAKSIRRVASFGIDKPSRSDPGRATFWKLPVGKDKWTEAGDYKGLTDTAETYAEHEASAFEIIMDDDDDDDGPDAESVAKKHRDSDRNQAGSIRYAVQRDCEWAIIFVGLGRQSVQKLEMKTAIRKSYRSKTLRLMNNTMTDTPPVIPYFIRGRSAGCRGSGVGVEPGGRPILKF